jgi:8-oxo-dGTP pyrophosphatase MutT (NUDIX family)
MRVREDEIEYADRSTSIYSIVEKPDFALVIPFENDGFWLVEQFRYSIGRRCWEFPQGTWSPGSEVGAAADLAVAELAEETGFTAADWRHLGRLFAAYGFSGQSFDVFLASGLEPGEPNLEASEQGMVHRWFAQADVRSMIASGELADSQSVAALTLFDLSARA